MWSVTPLSLSRSVNIRIESSPSLPNIITRRSFSVALLSGRQRGCHYSCFIVANLAFTIIAGDTSMAAAEFQLDEMWKLCKKGSVRNGTVGSSLLHTASSSSSSSSAVKRSSFTRRCARLVKEQRARFYIMRRCVTMLVCWRDYADA